MPAPLSHTRPLALNVFLYGSPYYPEHWPESVREGDPALFRAAGWNVVRMGEFAWDYLEPEPGRFRFELFDETIARFAAVGIRTILCTPTATPPRWLTRNHPETLRIDADGRPLSHGSRQHASHFSPVYREQSRRITRALAEHYRDNANVIGWQTDNEYHCHFAEDHGPDAQAGFAAFLRQRFAGDISALNRAWGTAFWSQTYDDFEDVPTPRPDRPTHLNPAHVLDYHRFLSDGVACFQREQVAILRAANPAWFVTHNGCFRSIDYRGPFTADLDFLGYDVYPMFEHDPAARSASQAASLDHARAWSGNFLVLEQQSGPGGQTHYLHDTPEPGEMRRMAYTSIARGADGLLFFRERTCPFGAEEYWCGILDHDNVPRRRYREAAQLGAELTRVGPAVLGTSVQVDMGIAGADFDNQQGHLALHHGLPSPKQAGEGIHRWAFDAGHAVGFVHPGDDLGGLASYWIPHFALFDPRWLPNLEGFVDRGGVLVIGARTGSKDRHNNVVTSTLPGVLRDLVGATVEEFGRQNRPDLRALDLEIGGESTPTEWWYEMLRPDDGTEVLARWRTRHLAGQAAITLGRRGRGAVIYVGTYFTPRLLAVLARTVADLGGLPNRCRVQTGIEIVDRRGPSSRLRFIINHRDESVVVPLDEPAHDLVTDRDVSGELELAPNDVAVLRR